MNDKTPLVLYVNPAWRREKLLHSVFLYPFWGGPPTNDTIWLREMLFKSGGLSAPYRITDDIATADVVFMPYAHKTVRRSYPELMYLCDTAAQGAGLPLFVDGIEDVECPLNTTARTFVLRYGGYRFERTDKEIIVPPFTNDMLDLYCSGILKIRQKKEKPSIGFAGWGALTMRQTLRTLIKELPDRVRGIVDNRFRAKKKGVFFRTQAMRLLQRSPDITCNFLVRSSYTGNITTVSKNAHTLQREFVDNLLESDYGLDVRGDANASTRLFEMLSLGCVPIIVDTERNFPFSDKIDYSSFALIVDFHDIKQLPERIIKFHNSISQERFAQMQRDAREAYTTYLRIDTLTKSVIDELRTKL